LAPVQTHRALSRFPGANLAPLCEDSPNDPMAGRIRQRLSNVDSEIGASAGDR